MTKFLISFLFIFLTLYSPLANIGVDLHLLDHEHHEVESHKHTHTHTHSHDQSKNNSDEIEESINLVSLVHHSGSDNDTDHEHFQSVRDILGLNFLVPELLPLQPLYIVMAHPLELREDQYYYKNWPSFIAQAYQPPPDQYRVLPLLN